MSLTISYEANTNFSPNRVNVLEKKILDELCDGQWHPEYKIKKELGENQLIESLKKLEEQQILISGMNNSFRMNSSLLNSWRNYTDFPNKDTERYTPRYFGGILEDDGWSQAELKNYDLIHFRTSGDISKSDVENIIQHNGLVTRSEDGLYRVFVKGSGDETQQIIKNHEFEEPGKSFSGVRLEKNIKRRDLKDLNQRYLSDLCAYYGEFSKVLLKHHMSTITKYIPERDDINQQIGLWVLDAVQRYDSTTSIPFAAYLGKSLSNWVFNLNRQSFGRSAADIEWKHVRASNQFRMENNREPSLEELAHALGDSLELVTKERSVIASVSNLRTMGTIDSDETVIHIPSEDRTDGRLEQQVHQYLISYAITKAIIETSTNKPNIVGLLNVYHTTWGNPKNKKLLPNSSSEETKNRVEEIMEMTRVNLEESGAF